MRRSSEEQQMTCRLLSEIADVIDYRIRHILILVSSRHSFL